ncbi:MAG TPA: ABC transporter substrate-binding protein [Clostridiales bacterium]|nr:ABC transporter substrate-binding protein [Clostridiales bacterium]
MFKRFLATVLLLAMVVAVMASCKNESTAKNEFLIGGIGPLTGSAATYGTSVKNAAQLAIDEINENGGVNGMLLKLNFQDDANNPEKAVNAYNTLMDAGMKVLLGTVTSQPCIAVVEESHKDGILQITPSGSAVDCIKYDNAFRICFNDPDQGTASATYIAENLDVKKIGVIYDKSNVYSTGIFEKFKAAAKEKGLEIVSEQAFTDQSNTDFSVQLQNIRESGAELIFIPVYYQEAAYILTQANQAGMSIPFFGCDGLDGIIPQLGDNAQIAEGVMLLTPFAADAQDEKTQKFVKAYKEKYGSIPDQFAADAYDGIYTIAEAIKKAGVTSPDDPDLNQKLIDAMTKIEVKGLTGTMTWDASGEPKKEPKAVKIVNGAYKSMQ